MLSGNKPLPEPMLTQIQCVTLNIFNDCHLRYLNLKIHSPAEFCCCHIFHWYQKDLDSNVCYKILRSYGLEGFFIALAIRLLLKLNTADLCCHMASLSHNELKSSKQYFELIRFQDHFLMCCRRCEVSRHKVLIKAPLTWKTPINSWLLWKK